MLDRRSFATAVTPFSVISYKGHPWTCEDETPNEYIIVGKDDPSLYDVLVKSQLDDLVASGKLGIRDELLEFLDFSIMKPSVRRVVAGRMIWISAAKTALQTGLVCDFGQASCQTIIDEMGGEVVRRYKNFFITRDFATTGKQRKIKFGSLSDKRKRQNLDVEADRILVHKRTLSDLMAAWERNPDPASLQPNWGNQKGGGKKMDQRTWDYVQKTGMLYLRENNRTQDGVLTFINAQITVDNIMRGEDARVPLATPYMVKKAIDELPSFAKMFTRRGPGRMVSKLRLVGEGPKFTRPGEEVILDGWKAHVHTLLNQEVQAMFSTAMMQTRLLIVPAIDHATGYIFGLSFAPTGETGMVTTKSLRMVGSSRDALARAAGCQSDWGPPLGVEILSQDSGTGLWNEIYMQAAHVIADSVDHKAAGLAWLRGTMERVLGTMDTKFVQNFIARTGSNILDMYESDPVRQAAIVCDFFMRLFVRYIVDVYHHTTRYKGRARRASPARELEAGLKMELKAPPTRDEMRLAYGKVLERTITPQGIRFMNIQYRNHWLGRLLANDGPDGSNSTFRARQIRIKVDPMDLGWISAEIEGRWVTVPGPSELRGVDLETWIEIGDRSAREVGEQARIDFERYVAPALLDIDAGARQAERSLGLKDLDWTAKMMNEAENLLRTFVVYDREPAGTEAAVSGSSRLLGEVMVRPDAPADAPATQPVQSDTTTTTPVVPMPVPTAASPTNQATPTRRPPRSRR